MAGKGGRCAGRRGFELEAQTASGARGVELPGGHQLVEPTLDRARGEVFAHGGGDGRGAETLLAGQTLYDGVEPVAIVGGGSGVGHGGVSRRAHRRMDEDKLTGWHRVAMHKIEVWLSRNPTFRDRGVARDCRETRCFATGKRGFVAKSYTWRHTDGTGPVRHGETWAKHGGLTRGQTRLPRNRSQDKE